MNTNQNFNGGPVLERLVTLLGKDVFFVPCEWGTKRPLVKYSGQPFEATQTQAYRSLFEGAPVNIAVYLGQASGGLCAIDFDAEEDLDAFMALNPKLAGTTTSRGSRGAMVWVRIRGEYPKSCNPAHRHFEWRATDRLSTISGRHPKGMEYSLVVDKAPLVLNFEEIVWPPGWELPWMESDDAELIRTYGEPFYKNEKGAITGINEAYWAGLHACENKILFEKTEKVFYLYSPETGIYTLESEDSIRKKISARMLEASRQMNAFDLQKRRTARTLNGVISHLKGIAEKEKFFPNRQSFIHVANGVIVVHGLDADLKPFSPDFRSRHRSPMVFDENAKCERFLNELVLPAVHPDDVELLQRFAGMFLLGYNRAQRILILDGEAGRGKTQFANVMQGLVGMDNVTQLRTPQLNARFELFRYITRSLLVGVDVEPDFLSTKGAAVLKGLVGGDWFDAEQKCGTGSFQFQGTLNVLITSNARLRVRLQGDVGAWRRRLNIVRYEAPSPERKINDFGAYLLETEGNGILNWALLGAQRVLREIPDEGGDLKLTERQRTIVDSLLKESDSLRHFLLEAIEVAADGDVTVSELVEAYAAYCPKQNWQSLPIREVHHQLETLMLELFRVAKRHDVQRAGKEQRGFYGVRLHKTKGNA